MDAVNRTAPDQIKPNQWSSFKPIVTGLTLCILFVFVGSISALAQTPSRQNGPAKRIPPLASHQHSPTSPAEQTLPPRFRGRSRALRAAALDSSSHDGAGHSANAATHELQKSSSQPTLPSNGFAFRPR